MIYKKSVYTIDNTSDVAPYDIAEGSIIRSSSGTEEWIITAKWLKGEAFSSQAYSSISDGIRDTVDQNELGISLNTTDISTNSGKIATNTSNISTNASDISTNSTAINTLETKVKSQIAVSGRVGSDGTLLFSSGSGWSSENVATGEYGVTFPSGATVNAFVVTNEGLYPGDMVITMSSNIVGIQIYRSTDSVAMDSAFSFFANITL